MVIDYPLLGAITESYEICLPKINDILQNIALLDFVSWIIWPLLICDIPLLLNFN